MSSYRCCKFMEVCSNFGDCDFCHHNPDACTQELFEWNGEGEEPTQEELEKNMY